MSREHILYLVASYLLGSIPFGYLIFRLTAKKDIRTLGSHSTGATNVLRNKGPLAALATIILDIAKGAAPIVFGLSHRYSPLLTIAAGAAVIVGHVFPVFIKFHGGKGVGPLVGVFLVFQWPALAVFLGVWLLVIALSRFVSLGSILGAVALFFAVLFTRTAEVAFVVLLVVILIVVKHRSNIQRLLAGTENKLRFGRSHGAS